MGIREVSAAFNRDYPVVPTHVGVNRESCASEAHTT
jgi:hypothetical protein